MNTVTRISMLCVLGAFAVAATPALAQNPPHNPAMRDACANDIKTLCSDAKPGQPTMQCMMKNRDKTSDGCKAAMSAMRGNGAGAMGGMAGQGQAQGGQPQGGGKPN